jgi:hypothetical protein
VPTDALNAPTARAKPSILNRMELRIDFMT